MRSRSLFVCMLRTRSVLYHMIMIDRYGSLLPFTRPCF